MEEKNQFGQVLGHYVGEWEACALPDKIILTGNYCKLEPVDITTHAKALYEVLHQHNDVGSWTYLPYGPFETEVAFTNWLKEKLAEKDTFLYAIFDVKTNSVVGIAGYLRVVPQHGVIEIGHLNFSNLLKRTPVATEAIFLLMKLAFDDLNYRRCEWKCNALNHPSRKAAERYGFQFEGVFRQNHVFKKYNRDTAWFSIIDKEWPAIKNKLEQWLHPDNFDQNGQQIRKLNQI